PAARDRRGGRAGGGAGGPGGDVVAELAGAQADHGRQRVALAFADQDLQPLVGRRAWPDARAARAFAAPAPLDLRVVRRPAAVALVEAAVFRAPGEHDPALDRAD